MGTKLSVDINLQEPLLNMCVDKRTPALKVGSDRRNFLRPLSALATNALLGLLLASCAPMEHPKFPPAPDPVTEAVEVAIGDLAKGTIVFDVPKKMQVGKRERAVVRISRRLIDKLPEAARQQLRAGLRSPEEERIQVGDRMAAYLLDPDSAFTIRGLFDEKDREQRLQATTPAEWEWRVRPERRGEHELALTVTAIVFVEGRDGPERVTKRVFSRLIPVQANLPYSAKRFWGNYWQWILGWIIGLPAAIGGVLALRRR